MPPCPAPGSDETGNLTGTDHRCRAFGRKILRTPRFTDPMKNIVLIGLPTAGKSTLGVILAKTLGMKFIDTDIVIQEKTGRPLQAIIDEDGIETFLEIEEKTLLSLNCHNAIIATGGSVVYSKQAMEHLKSDGMTVYLEISFDEMIRRLKNITTRGIVLVPGQSLRDLYNQRVPLYENYSDLRVDCSRTGFEDVIDKLIDKIQKSQCGG